jgi:outer membrane protein assembly factor BamB
MLVFHQLETTMTRILFPIVCCLLPCSLLHADSWPQFRGPGGSAVGPEGGSVPTSWGDAKNVKWKTALPGPGSSSPVYRGDKLFVTCYSGYGTDVREIGKESDLARHLLCLDRGTGKILWKKSVPLINREDSYRGYITEHGYASSTPVTDGKHVYVFYGKSGVHAYTMDGEKVWSREAGKSSGNRRWGSGSSPVLHGDLLIVSAADESRAVIALDKTSGEERWRYESGKLELAYNTPTIRALDGGKAEVVLSAPTELFALDAETGKRRWWLSSTLAGNVCPSVVIAGGHVCTFGGYPRKGSLGAKLEGEGDLTGNIAWQSKVTTYVPTPIALGEHLYWVNDESQAVVMKTATGELVKMREVEGIVGTKKRTFYASVVRSGDKLFAVSRKNGTFVFEANPGMKLVAHNKLGDDSDFNATPALAKDAIYLRSNRAVYCIAE